MITNFGDLLLDSLIDSSWVLLAAFVIYVAISFCETWIAKQLTRNKALSPLLGSLFGLVPQCGFSVVASDLYLKQKISMGTLVAVFIACSDEALPIFLSNPSTALSTLPLLGIKFALGFIVGYSIDLIHKPQIIEEEHHEHDEKEEENDIHIGCCGHEIDDDHENKWHKHLVHPLIHSLKIFAYVLIVNIIFNVILYYVGEDNLKAFLSANKYLAPLYSTLIGLIPNCVSSVIISELYISSSISFGAALSGLIVNAGLGMLVLLKDRRAIKKTLVILLITFSVALLAGYISCLIAGF